MRLEWVVRIQKAGGTVIVAINTLLLLLGVFVNFKNTFTMQAILEAQVPTVIMFSLIGVSGLMTQIKGYKKLVYSLKHDHTEDKEVQWMRKNGFKLLIAIGVIECIYMYASTMQIPATGQAVMFIGSIFMYTVVNTVETYATGFLLYIDDVNKSETA